MISVTLTPSNSLSIHTCNTNNSKHITSTGQVGLGVVSWPSNRTNGGSPPSEFDYTSIRCNHTHNTHWVHLKCTHMQQRQYKPDCRCTIHTPTQNVTIPSTDNTTRHHKQTTTHPLTNNNQPKDKKHRHTSNQHKRHQKQNRGTKNLVHSTQPDIIIIQETKLTQKVKTPKIPHYTTIRTHREHKQGGGSSH